MREVYGQTENCGLATGMPPDRIKLGTVGVARPDTEVSVSPEGEILLRGPHVFMGYLNQPEKTAETLRDGWLHTGDVGASTTRAIFRITDRMKDIIITAGGKNITPSEIENQLKFSPYISDAVVIGDKRKFLTVPGHDRPRERREVRPGPQRARSPTSPSLCRAPRGAGPDLGARSSG